MGLKEPVYPKLAGKLNDHFPYVWVTLAVRILHGSSPLHLLQPGHVPDFTLHVGFFLMFYLRDYNRVTRASLAAVGVGKLRTVSESNIKMKIQCVITHP